MEMRPVLGFDGYFVTECGRVFSTWKRGPVSGPGTGPLRELSKTIAGAGYRSVMLGRKGRRYVHRLVALAFIGPQPPGCEVCHIDGNKDNNHCSNLEWKTHAENMKDQRSQGNLRLGADHPQSKLSREQREVIRERFLAGDKIAALARNFGACDTTIRRVIYGRERP